ncbi:signal transduction histidine kinase regulating citrate/malate metabolism [Ruegeria lacuscaerulensis ITI-1157]|nr:signal transduction histidine kinase regulating citrate/malate metabolism [Ruegeria lacuscaerulensis ITI-1157]SHJ05855.1 hypothetical protein SAMN05444404_1325 [Ruegeria lacuscaerulensis ITI-1157]
MTGKMLAILIVVCAVAAGVGMYYLQVYGYYYTVTPTPGRDVVLTEKDSGQAVPIAYDAFQAIDADSSPIRYRACFETDLSPEQLAGRFVPAEDAEPLTAPAWFDCYDAEALGKALESGAARAFIGVKNIHYGVDRVVAVTQDGHGFAWHVLNNCGEKAYDGTVVGEECPPRPEN